VASEKCYVAIKGKVFDVTGNKSYIEGGSYHGHDASRALALTSTKAEDVKPEWQDLADDKKKVLDDWMTFFSKRYNVVGLVEGSTNQ
ncbi:putative steroid-binding protein, partial [Lachnellula willkommii]